MTARTAARCVSTRALCSLRSARLELTAPAGLFTGFYRTFSHPCGRGPPDPLESSRSRDLAMTVAFGFLERAWKKRLGILWCVPRMRRHLALSNSDIRQRRKAFRNRGKTTGRSYIRGCGCIRADAVPRAFHGRANTTTRLLVRTQERTRWRRSRNEEMPR